MLTDHVYKDLSVVKWNEIKIERKTKSFKSECGDEESVDIEYSDYVCEFPSLRKLPHDSSQAIPAVSISNLLLVSNGETVRVGRLHYCSVEDRIKYGVENEWLTFAENGSEIGPEFVVRFWAYLPEPPQLG